VILCKHTITKSSNIQCVGLTHNPLLVRHWYKLPDLCTRHAAHCSSRQPNYFRCQCLLPCLFTFKLWHRFCDFRCRF